MLWNRRIISIIVLPQQWLITTIAPHLSWTLPLHNSSFANANGNKWARDHAVQMLKQDHSPFHIEIFYLFLFLYKIKHTFQHSAHFLWNHTKITEKRFWFYERYLLPRVCICFNLHSGANHVNLYECVCVSECVFCAKWKARQSQCTSSVSHMWCGCVLR